jgi:hypothetical protein
VTGTQSRLNSSFWILRELRILLRPSRIGLPEFTRAVSVALMLARPEPFAYLVAHGLKILGGVGGGLVAGRRRALAAATE